MPITTDFEVFSSKYHNRPIYVDDPMDLPETAIMIQNLNNEYDTLYDEKKEIESKYNDMYLNMYKLKHATKMLVIHEGMKQNLWNLHHIDDGDIWEYRVKDSVSNIDDEIMELIEDYVDLSDKKQELMNKFIN